MNRLLVPLLLPAAVALTVSSAFAEAAPQPPRIVVVGEGEAAVAPDLALLTLGVMREAVTAGEALDAANKAMSENTDMRGMEMPFDARRMFWGGFEVLLDE